MIEMKVPFSFIHNRTDLSWSDVQEALERSLISPSVCVDLAMSEIGNESCDPVLIDLASQSPDEPVLEKVSILASNESAPPNLSKLLYLVLAWAYENRSSSGDPLDLVEQIYADFDYPKEIANFVRYMPMDGGDLGSKEANEGRLMDRWREYVEGKEQASSS